MRKIAPIFYFIILTLICQPIVAVNALSENQKVEIMAHCDTIKDDLKRVQKDDSKARVYLGSYYEIILSKFIIPLNVRLVENNLSTADLVENQNDLATTKADFVNDFVDYQKELETLVNIDCKTEPENFDQKLKVVRDKRQAVAEKLQKMRSLVNENIKLVTGIKGKLSE